jgi:hypothetical protein
MEDREFLNIEKFPIEDPYNRQQKLKCSNYGCLCCIIMWGIIFGIGGILMLCIGTICIVNVNKDELYITPWCYEDKKTNITFIAIGCIITLCSCCFIERITTHKKKHYDDF